jgi:hypothetical protein
VKGRNWADNGQNVDWGPTSDAHYGDPENITASVSFGDGKSTATVSHTFTLYPGHLHPFPGRQVFHSSWVAEDHTAKANETVASAGVNVWKVPDGAYPAQHPGADGGTNWEIWWSKT